jgi:acetyl esterase/lipase
VTGLICQRSVEDRTIPSGRRIWVELVTRQSALNGYMTGEHLPPFSSTHCITKLVGPGLPPTVLVLAEADQILDPSQTRELFERLLESGVEAKLIVAKGMPHGALERPRSTWPEGAEWWDEVAVPALEWAIARCE